MTRPQKKPLPRGREWRAPGRSLRAERPAEGARWAAPVLLVFLAACSSAQRATSPPWPGSAEFAIRWDAAAGGPQTPQEVLTLLELPVPEAETYRVRYWDLPVPSSAPPNAVPILRERSKAGGKIEFRLKYRFPAPLTAWSCPAGEGFQPEEEVDVSVRVGGNATRVYSYACTLKAAAPPSSLNATPKNCSVTMTRFTAEGLKVEEWVMPDGARTIEVSRAAADSVDELASFRQVAEKLFAKGAKPADRSKTELGSDCP